MITFSGDQIRRAQEVLRHLPGKMPKVMANALNRAADSAKTEAARQVSKKYVINKSNVSKTISIRGAKETQLRATIKSKGTRRPLTEFKIKPLKISVGRGKNRPKVLRVEQKRGEKTPYPGLFLNYGRITGKLHALKRIDNNSNTIHIKYGLSVPEMMGVKSVKEHIENKAQETLDKRLEHEINRLLNRRR